MEIAVYYPAFFANFFINSLPITIGLEKLISTLFCKYYEKNKRLRFVGIGILAIQLMTALLFSLIRFKLTSKENNSQNISSLQHTIFNNLQIILPQSSIILPVFSLLFWNTKLSVQNQNSSQIQFLVVTNLEKIAALCASAYFLSFCWVPPLLSKFYYTLLTMRKAELSSLMLIILINTLDHLRNFWLYSLKLWHFLGHFLDINPSGFHYFLSLALKCRQLKEPLPSKIKTCISTRSTALYPPLFPPIELPVSPTQNQLMN
uniref:Uncharacterized protein n=1 Tax=Meloidogyne enterolobii TaxID=390850 RepID=A0A6V7UJ68_MELEN|nr:unnamed protein product [Meloidogyne enterolobii]